VAVAWGSRAAEECLPTGAKRVYAAVRTAGTRSFHAARLLGAGSFSTCESRTIDVAVGPDGGTTVAWSLWDDRVERSVHVAALDAHGRMVSSDRLGTGNLADVAIASDGTAMVTWNDRSDPTDLGDYSMPPSSSPGHALAALRAPEADRFGASELVSAEDEDAFLPVAAFAPRTRRPLLQWLSLPRAGDPPRPGELRTAARATG
jgi:hypothetical protein